MLSSTLRHSSRVAGRRFQSSGTSTTFLHAHKQQTFRKNWLSDPSTYPMIAVLGAAGVLCVGVMASCMFFSPDVRVDPKKRNAMIRTWGLPGYKA